MKRLSLVILIILPFSSSYCFASSLTRLCPAPKDVISGLTSVNAQYYHGYSDGKLKIRLSNFSTNKYYVNLGAWDITINFTVPFPVNDDERVQDFLQKEVGSPSFYQKLLKSSNIVSRNDLDPAPPSDSFPLFCGSNTVFDKPYLYSEKPVYYYNTLPTTITYHDLPVGKGEDNSYTVEIKHLASNSGFHFRAKT